MSRPVAVAAVTVVAALGVAWAAAVFRLAHDQVVDDQVRGRMWKL